jgi:hypothetical protein
MLSASEWFTLFVLAVLIVGGLLVFKWLRSRSGSKTT